MSDDFKGLEASGFHLHKSGEKALFCLSSAAEDLPMKILDVQSLCAFSGYKNPELFNYFEDLQKTIDWVLNEFVFIDPKIENL